MIKTIQYIKHISIDFQIKVCFKIFFIIQQWSSYNKQFFRIGIFFFKSFLLK